jgi:hypothetical protein
MGHKTTSDDISGDNTSSNKSLASSWGPLCCYCCGGPHHWSLLENGIHVIKGPNANNSGILNNAKKVIKHIRNKHKKKQLDFTKHKNLATPTTVTSTKQARNASNGKYSNLSLLLPKVQASPH